MSKMKKIYSCSKCGAQFPKWSGRCLECGAWGTVAEETIDEKQQEKQQEKKDISPAKLVSLKDTPDMNTNRMKTGFLEVDRVLGGGIIPGSLTLIGGEPGVGKSTMVSAVMGLSGYNNYTGDIIYKGESIKGLSVDERARKGITMAWQEPARFEGLTVGSFIKAGADDKSESNINKMIENVGLDHREYYDRAVDKTLSGGERKRIELASIMSMKPELVIMDEPDSGIDVNSLYRIFDAIGDLKSNGSTVLLITHSLSVLEQADHAFLMCCGRVLQKGSVKEINKKFSEQCVPCDHKNNPEADGE